MIEIRLKGFVELQKNIQDAIDDFDHLKGLMNEAEFFDDNGEGIHLTDRGYA